MDIELTPQTTLKDILAMVDKTDVPDGLKVLHVMHYAATILLRHHGLSETQIEALAEFTVAENTGAAIHLATSDPHGKQYRVVILINNGPVTGRVEVN
jgi:hypothetical protein